MPNTANATEPKQDWLKDAGVNVSDVGVPFFKPTGRPARAKITGVRPGDGRPKPLPMGGEVVVLCVVDLEVEGVPHVWEVTSKRAVAQLRQHGAIGAWVEISTTGRGTQTTYKVERFDPDAPKVRARKSVRGTTYELLDNKKVRITDAEGNITTRDPEPGEWD